MRWRWVFDFLLHFPQSLTHILQDIDSIGPGEICAIFGVDCASGDTFTDGATSYSMVSQPSLEYNTAYSSHLGIDVRP